MLFYVIQSEEAQQEQLSTLHKATKLGRHPQVMLHVSLLIEVNVCGEFRDGSPGNEELTDI